MEIYNKVSINNNRQFVTILSINKTKEESARYSSLKKSVLSRHSFFYFIGEKQW